MPVITWHKFVVSTKSGAAEPYLEINPPQDLRRHHDAVKRYAHSRFLPPFPLNSDGRMLEKIIGLDSLKMALVVQLTISPEHAGQPTLVRHNPSLYVIPGSILLHRRCNK